MVISDVLDSRDQNHVKTLKEIISSCERARLCECDSTPLGVNDGETCYSFHFIQSEK